ncbi:hypothetical protein VTI74DRAFT_5603 [Chaetomium olivicolor]
MRKQSREIQGTQKGSSANLRSRRENYYLKSQHLGAPVLRSRTRTHSHTGVLYTLPELYTSKIGIQIFPTPLSQTRHITLIITHHIII